jgi:hypothetical protein
MEWGTMWDAISQSIYINLKPQLSQKYRTIDKKIRTITLQQPQQEDSRFTFHPRVVNKTDKETALLQKGLNYNLQYKPANWIQRLGMEAETDSHIPPTGTRSRLHPPPNCAQHSNTSLRSINLYNKFCCIGCLLLSF